MGADILDTTIKNIEGKTPLYIAIEYSNLQFVKHFLKLGANPNESCFNGNTPMHVAFKKKLKIVYFTKNLTFKIINLLIKHRGNFNVANDAGEKPIDYASRKFLKELNIVELDFINH